MSKRKSESINEAKAFPSRRNVPANSIDGHLWHLIIAYLPTDDLQSLRLASGKFTLHFHNPLFTSHLPLRMDLVPFFGVEPISQKWTGRHMLQWMHNRRHLIIQGPQTKNLHPAKVRALVTKGYMKSVTKLSVDHMAHHRMVIGQLANMPNLKHVELYDRFTFDKKGKYYEGVIRVTGAIVDSIGRMTGLESLVLDFDVLVSSQRLAILENLPGLKSLILRGFDCSEGLEPLAHLKQLEHLEISHGNTFHHANKELPTDVLTPLMNLQNLKKIHLENMNNMCDEHIKPLSQLRQVTSLTFKHCQEMKGGVLSSVGLMTSLEEFHIIHCCMDDTELFESEELEQLQSLKKLKVLTLMFVMIDQYDVLDLEGLVELETLNVGFPGDMSQEEFNTLIRSILPVIPKLKRMRIFGFDICSYDLKCDNYDMEFRFFHTGGQIELD